MTPTITPVPELPLLGISLLFIYKVLILVGLFSYAIFALILIQQVKAKRDTLRTRLGPYLEILAVVHFILTVLLFALALFIL